MDKETLVYVDLDGVPHLMGRLWARVRKNKESATFEYDKAWRENRARFSLEPALTVGPGPFHTPADTPMFGAIGDPAPDHTKGRPAGVFRRATTSIPSPWTSSRAFWPPRSTRPTTRRLWTWQTRLPRTSRSVTSARAPYQARSA